MPYDPPAGQIPADDFAVAVVLLCEVGRKVVRREHPAGNNKTNGRWVIIRIFQATSQANFVLCSGQSRMLPAAPQVVHRMAKNRHFASGGVHKNPQNRNYATVVARRNAPKPDYATVVAIPSTPKPDIAAVVARPGIRRLDVAGVVARPSTRRPDSA